LPGRILIIKILAVLLLALFPDRARSQTYIFDFQNGYQEWSGDFADYPVTDSIFYQLAFKRAHLPAPLDTGKYALMISGNNHSDDLFMFIKRKITGLTPNKVYKLLIEIELASDVPTNAVGIGGAPGESVFLKAGASLVEPLKIASDGFFLMNIDKSNQSMPGADMDTIGHIGVTDTTTVYTLIRRSNESRLFTFSTDEAGSVWVCIGTDSGFEGTTTLYYNKVTLTFDNMTGTPHDRPVEPAEPVLFPNPADDILIIRDKTAGIRLIEVFNSAGKLSGSISQSDRIQVGHLPTGTYSVRITYDNHPAVTKKIIIQ
jgi:hypothetical protein